MPVSPLFTPIALGAIHARNRILMSPMTRGRATRDHVPTAIMEEYYRQRAGAGLIISEATGISQQGMGWPYAPGIWSPAQVDGWKRVTDAVHAGGGKIICQLWHMGRMVHSSFNGGQPPVSASATVSPYRSRTYDGPAAAIPARALDISEIQAVVADFGTAAANAIAAGFDGIQLHGGSGYLLEQFMRDGTNLREDGYGGSIGNRLRFLMEVLDAVCGAIGPGRVSLRLSPNVAVSGCVDSDPAALFTQAVQAVDPLGLGFLELREAGPDGVFGITDADAMSPVLRGLYRGPLVLNEDYDLDTATRALADGRADAISFGRAFIANPDLPHRMAQSMPLARDDRSLWYTPGANGYCDYPTMAG